MEHTLPSTVGEGTSATRDTAPSRPAPRPAGLAPGTRLARYQIAGSIGAGGMGAVYEARHSVLNKPVALKTLHGPLHARNLHDRFLHEAEIAARVRHPHVVDIYDAGIEHNVPFVVMELLEGESLATYLSRRGALSLRECLDVAVPLVAALAEVHRHGIVHRDVKPENVFLALDTHGDVRVKLVDFGISKELELLQAETPGAKRSLEGTPAYMSPEEFLSLPGLDSRVDQYGVGLLIYECLSGRRPFAAESLVALAYQVCHGDCLDLAALCPELPESFVQIVRRTMAVDRSERFSSTEELGAALLCFADAPMRDAYQREFAHDRGRATTPERRSWRPPPASVGVQPGIEPPCADGAARRGADARTARHAFLRSALVTGLLMLGAAAGWCAARQPATPDTMARATAHPQP